MKHLIFIVIILVGFKAVSADEITQLRMEKPTRFAISSGLVYENLGSQNFMLQVGAAYKTRPRSTVGIAGGIAPVSTEGATPDIFLQVFWENKDWVYSANYNWLEVSQFASAGIGYNLNLYRSKNLSVRSGLGIDIVAQQLPSEFMIRTGLLSLAPKLGVNVVLDL